MWYKNVDDKIYYLRENGKWHEASEDRIEKLHFIERAMLKYKDIEVFCWG